jgi:cysteinyl-tRNA synthetase
VGWDSPWGKGRPGWHIECSALSMEHLGSQIDIHGGGTDLRFPHHENEIAQSEAATGVPFVRHWFHVEHLLVDGQKMAKSTGNMYTVREVLERGYTGPELRYALIYSAHYRNNLNFTWQGIENAKIALQRIDEWRKRLKDVAVNSGNQVASGSRSSLQQSNLNALSLESIDQLLSDDLNISGLLGKLFITIRASHGEMDASRLTPDEARELELIWDKLNAVLGLEDATVTVPAEVQALLDQRAAARKAKDFAKSDELRKAIEALGWKVKDTAKGQELSPG